MKAKELHKKSIKELNIDLLNLRHKQFNLRVKAANNKLKQTHLLKQIRRDIAKIKTLLTKM